MVAALATRPGLTKADEGCTVLATIVLPAYRRAVTRWPAGPASGDPGALVAEEFDLLAVEPGSPANGRARLKRS